MFWVRHTSRLDTSDACNTQQRMSAWMMARLALPRRLSAAVFLVTTALITAALAPATPANASAHALLSCLEPIAQTFHERIVDASGQARPVACVRLERNETLRQAMDRQLRPNGLAWHRLADGTLEVIAADAASSLQLPALEIEADPLPVVQRPDTPVSTPLIEHATASTTLDRRWLDSAPLLGFNQISQFAPNVYGSGQSLAIRGTERNDDAFPALSVTYDGIDLGTRLLDDELVPLDDVTNLDIARGPRSFVSTGESQAGAIALKTADPSADPTASVRLGAGTLGARDGSVSWSGPLWAPGLNATIAFYTRQSDGLIRQLAVPAANVDERSNDFAHFKLSYAPESPSGLSAQLTAIALSGDSSDRDVVARRRSGGGQPPPFDPFQRDSYSAYPVLAQTRARGGAGFVRYESAQDWAVDAHASITTILRDATELPDQQHWTDRELWRRLGLTASAHPASDWTIVGGLERSDVTTASFTPIPPAGPLRTHYVTVTDSASLWIEHSWAGIWTAGLGVRWVEESKSYKPVIDAEFTSRLPIPLAVVEWRPRHDQAFSLSYGTGYRNGGPLSGSPIVPERSENFELAWRGQWFDGALHTALAAFAGEIRDRFTYYQLDNTGQPLLGRVRDRGVEFELDSDLSDYWKLRAGVGVLSSRYSAIAYRYGETTSEAPPHTATLGIRYGLAHGWYAAMDAYRAAGVQLELSSNPTLRVPAYDVANFRIGYRSSHWEGALIATNAFGANYVERVQANLANLGYRLGDPRRVELRVKWIW